MRRAHICLEMCWHNSAILSYSILVVWPAGSPALIFFLKLVMCLVLCWVLCLIFRIVAKRNKGNNGKDTVFKVVWMLFLIFYMTSTIVSVLLFQFLRSPNGSSSLRYDPAVICRLSESKYDGMFILGVCGVYLIRCWVWLALLMLCDSIPSW